MLLIKITGIYHKEKAMDATSGEQWQLTLTPGCIQCFTGLLIFSEPDK